MRVTIFNPKSLNFNNLGFLIFQTYHYNFRNQFNPFQFQLKLVAKLKETNGRPIRFLSRPM